MLLVVGMLLLTCTIKTQQINPNIVITANPLGNTINACQSNLTLSVIIATIPSVQGGVLLSRNFTWLVNSTTASTPAGSVISTLSGTTVNTSIIIVNTQLLKTNTKYFFGVNITDRIQNRTTITTVSQLAFLNNAFSVNNGTAIGGSPALPVCHTSVGGGGTVPVSQSKKGQVSVASPSVTYGGVLYHVTCLAVTLLVISVSLMLIDVFFYATG